MPGRPLIPFMLALLLHMVCSAAAAAAEPSVPASAAADGASMPQVDDVDDDSRRQQVAQEASEFCSQLEFSAVGTPSLNHPEATRAVLFPEPILRWSNPTIGSVLGDVYLWTLDGRPAVVASWYRYSSPAWGRTLEVSLLGPHALQGEHRGTRFWSPQSGGSEFQPLHTSLTPAATRSGRIAQLRQLASEFEVLLRDTRVPSDASGGQVVERSLRQLTRPLFRYDPEHLPEGCVDGALFAFVEGTDPELFLNIEVWSEAGTTSKTWHYNVARMNGDGLEVRYRSQSVARFEALVDTQEQPAQTYTLFTLERPLSRVPQ